MIFVTRNVAFYSLSDATVCCSTGTHGVSGAQSFIIGSYFDRAVMPRYTDIQAITQQLGEWFNDPLRANKFPRWLKPPANRSCGGAGESSSYLLEQPTDFMPGENAAQVGRFHLENMALLAWFAQAQGAVYSFPNATTLSAPAQPCASGRGDLFAAHRITIARRYRYPETQVDRLLGGYSSVRSPTPLRDVSPEWDIVIATFATPVKGSTALLHFSPPAALGDEKFKADVAFLKASARRF